MKMSTVDAIRVANGDGGKNKGFTLGLICKKIDHLLLVHKYLPFETVPFVYIV